MRTVVISDIHLGARQCRAGAVAAFLDALPPGDQLILNGDVITHFATETSLPDTHRLVLQKLRDMSHDRKIIWIRGNNDRDFQLQDPADLVFAMDYALDDNVYITHGDRFDHLMPTLRLLLIPLRVVYEFCTRVAGRETHVASFAKRFPAIYNVLNGHVAGNAIAYARKHGFSVVTCGHTHHPETRVVEGIRYFNTGSWTENATCALIVDNGEVTLEPIPSQETS